MIYFVWGSTYLAIRVGVREVPPFLLAAVRFFVAGVVMYLWMRARGTPSPTRREWAAASIAVLIFVFDYGLVFWAEQRVPSGIAAVMMATIPVFMALSEIRFPPHTEAHPPAGGWRSWWDWPASPFWSSRSVELWRKAVDTSGAIALVVAAISWSRGLRSHPQTAAAGLESR